jgi:hypothetical protein
MTVSNGNPGNATTFNNAFISRTQDSDTIGEVKLDAPSSGDTVDNAQASINELADAIGMSDNADSTTATTYANNNVIVDGENHKQSLEKLDAAFDTTTGHTHDGVDAPQVDAADLDNINNYFCEYQEKTITAASGTDHIVTTDFSGESPSGGAATEGVITYAPANKVALLNATNGGQIEDGEGQRVYGRLTESAGVWTLSFYTLEAGVETAHSLSSQDVLILYREVFTQATRPTITADVGVFESSDLTADIADASATVPGKVSTGTQSFAGNKTFTGTIGASNLSGTNTGDATLTAIGATPNANGASLSGQALTLQPADLTNGGVVTALAQTFGGAKTFDAALKAANKFLLDFSVDSSTNGTDLTLATPTKGVGVFSHASFDSVEGITAPSGQSQVFVMVNQTGGQVVLKNESGTAANQIVTGTASDYTMEDKSCVLLVYEQNASKWYMIGGGGGAGVDLSAVNQDIIPAADNTYKIGDFFLGMWSQVNAYSLYGANLTVAELASFWEQAGHPSSPASGTGYFYNYDSYPYYKRDNGEQYSLAKNNRMEGTISTPTFLLNGYSETVRVYNDASSQTLATIGGVAPQNGEVITIVGSSDTNTFSVNTNDVSNGWLLNGPAILGRGDLLQLMWSTTLSRWVEIARSNISSGSGGINYVTNGEFETNVDGWTDSGGTLTITRSDTTPLRGIASGVITNGANNDYIKYPFTIADADKAKILRIGFDIDTGALADNELQVSIYDATNLVTIPVVDGNIKAGVSPYVGEFQTASDSNSYELRITQIAETSGWTTAKIDNVQVGPREIARGSVVTDWVDYTPASSLTLGNGSQKWRWRRVGDSMEIEGSILTGSTTSISGSFYAELPSGHSFDTAKLKRGSATSYARLGTATMYYASGTQYREFFQVIQDAASVVRFKASGRTDSGTTGDLTGTFPVTIGASDELYFFVKVPISGWSSNTTISTDFGGRVIAMYARPAQPTGTLANSENLVSWGAATKDEVSGWNGTNTYTVQESGYYSIEARSDLTLDSDAGADDSVQLRIQVNSATVMIGQTRIPVNAGSTNYNAHVSLNNYYLTAGQTVRIVSLVDSSATATFVNNSGSHYFGLHKIQSPQTLMGGEVVVASYTSNSPNSVAVTTPTFVDYEDKVKDTHGIVSGAGSGSVTASGTGFRITIPVNGNYQLSVGNRFASSADWAATESAKIEVYLNGSLHRSLCFSRAEAASTWIPDLHGSCLLTLTAGDLVEIVITQTGAASLNFTSATENNWMTIYKVN